MVVGVCRISLLLEDAQSVKDKRSVLRRIKDRVTQKWNCAIAEVGDVDVWQTAQLGFAVVSNERGFTQSLVQKILTFIDDLALAKLVDDEQDYIDYGDGVVEGGSATDYPHWEPEEPSPPKPQPPMPQPARLEASSYPWDSPEPIAPIAPAASGETDQQRDSGDKE
jgi:uncharacterized protein YlxP (DUF503 family)